MISVCLPLQQILIKMEEVPNKMKGVGILTDHVLLILYRLTARSLCNCKCVYRSWNHLISDVEYQKDMH